MLPILLAVNALFLSAGIFIARQAHVNAATLIRKEAEATRLARTDHLSQLPNRLAFAEYCEEMDRRKNIDVAVIQIDMDRFKQVNDVIGHAGGDELICQFSERLAKLKDANTFVARVGGDEFVVICSSTAGGSEFWRAKLRELEKMLLNPVHCGGLYFDLSASIGVALKTAPNDPIEDVVWRSDRAMYHAKQHQISDFVLYDEMMSAGDQARNAIEKAMRYALRNTDEFFIEYQPIIDCANGETMVRAEALARWHSPLLGDVSPSRFIPVAEQTGLIVSLGWLLVELICKDLAAFPGLNVSINVSPVQLVAPGFVDELFARVSAHGVDCSRVDIELTETLAISGDFDGNRRSSSAEELWFLDLARRFRHRVFVAQLYPPDSVQRDQDRQIVHFGQRGAEGRLLSCVRNRVAGRFDGQGNHRRRGRDGAPVGLAALDRVPLCAGLPVRAARTGRQPCAALRS
ncbi:MAG: diguanylate cyclase [Paenirhodobacter sp.]